MAYVALKPCSFAGQSFRIGDSVPGELIHPGAANNLVKMNIIAAEGSTEAPAKDGLIPISIPVDDGAMSLAVTRDGLQAIFSAMTTTAEEAEPIVKAMTDGDALILLHMSESRKSIKAAAEARAKELGEQ